MDLAELFEDVTTDPAFQKWFEGSQIVDKNGNPLKLYRGMRGYPNLNDVDFTMPRKGYAVFFSTSPYVAASYSNPNDYSDEAGAIYPVYVKATLKEFPAKMVGGRRSFDMFSFDTVASRLQAGEGVVVRQVVDIGPRANSKIDPEKLYSYASDIYAFGKGTEIRSAVGHRLSEAVKKPFTDFLVYGSFTDPSSGKNAFVVRMPSGRVQWTKKIVPAISQIVKSFRTPEELAQHKISQRAYPGKSDTLRWYIEGSPDDNYSLWDSKLFSKYEWDGEKLIPLPFSSAPESA